VFVVSSFLVALARIVDTLLWAYMWVIIIRAVLSWVSPDPYNPIVQFFYRATEPVLRPIRRRLPTWQMGMDLSPIVVILIIVFLQYFLIPVLFETARRVA
jgi:YggT family protein